MTRADSPDRVGKRPLIIGIIAAVIGIFFALIGVLNWPHMLALVAIIVALDYASSQGRENIPKPWPKPPMRFRRGARAEIARLAWSTVDREGDVTETALQRVRDLAQIELAKKGVTWTGHQGDPMLPTQLAQQLIGPAAVTTLTTNQHVRPRALENVVSKLELLRSSQ